MSYRRPYIESSVFIAWIIRETEERYRNVQSIIDAASTGRFPIVTATWTIAEVHKRKRFSPNVLTEKQSEDILPYFREDYIDLVEIDRSVAERAHALCREFLPDGKRRALSPGDAVHIAAAEKFPECDVILSYDPDLLKLEYTKIPIKEPEFVPAVEPAPSEETSQPRLWNGGENQKG